MVRLVASGVGTVVEQSPHHSKAEGLSPAVNGDAGIKKNGNKLDRFY